MTEGGPRQRDDPAATIAEIGTSEHREPPYRSLVENAADLMYVLDADGLLTYVSPPLVRALGYDDERELLGRWARDIIAHEDHAKTDRAFHARLAGETVPPYEFSLRRRDGTRLPVEIASSLVRDADGRPAGTQAILRDVSARRRAQYLQTARSRILEELAVGAPQLDALALAARHVGHLARGRCLIAMRDGVAWRVAADGADALGDLAAARLASDPDALGDGERRAVEDLEGGLVPAALAELMRAAAARSCVIEPVRTPDGAVVGAVVLLHPEPGPLPVVEETLVEWVVDVSAVTIAWGRREQALRDREAIFRQLTEAIREVFWLTDWVENRVLYGSPSYERIWGRSCQSLYDAPASWAEAIHPADRTDVEAAFRAHAASGGFDVEYRIVHPEGEVRWIHDRAFPMTDRAGKVVRVAGLSEDVTDRKRVEHQARVRERMLRRHNRVLGTLSRAAPIHAGELEEAFEIISTVAARTLGVERVGIWLYEDEGRILRCHHLHVRSRDAHGPGPELRAADHPAYFAALEENRIIASDDARRDPRTREFRDAYLEPHGISSMMDAPIRAEGRPIGAVCHEHVGPARAWTAEEQAFAGSIGDFAAMALQARRRRDTEHELRRRDAILQAVSFAAERFLAADWEEEIGGVLRRVGEAASVSRAYVFENEEDAGGLRMCQRHEWAAPGVPPVIDAPVLRGLPYADGFERWRRQLESGAVVQGELDGLPLGERVLLESLGVRSIVVVPVFVDGSWWGYIGFDDCARARRWSDAELDALRAAAGLLGSAIQRSRAERALRHARDELSVRVEERTAELSRANRQLEREVAERRRTEIALRASEARRQGIIDAIPGAVYQYRLEPDGEQRFTYMSRGIEELTGLGADDASRDFSLVWDRIVPEDADRVAESIRASAESMEPWSQQFRIRTVDGRLRWLRGSSVPEPRRDRGAVTWNGVLVDITERVRAEEAARESEARLHSIIDNTTAVVYLKDADGRYVLINREFERLFHVEREAVVGCADLDLFPPETAAAFRENDLAVAQLDRAMEFEEVAPLDDGPHTYLSVKFPLRDASGEVYAVCGISTDITARKRMERALRESEERFRQMAEHIREVFWLWDCVGDRMLYASPAFETIWGEPPARLEASPALWWKRLHDDDRDRVRAALAALAEGGAYDEVYRVVRRDGTTRWVHDRGFPIHDGGRVYRVAGIATDVTEQREMRAQVQQLERSLANAVRLGTLGVVSAGIAHELNQPLAAIENYIGACMARLRSGEHDRDELIGIMQRLSSQAARGGDIIQHLKTLVRKGDESRRAMADLNDVIREALPVLDGALHDATIELALAARLPEVEIDPVQIQLVIINLVRNAAEAMQALPVTERIVEIRTEATSATSVRVVVSDTGPGVPEQAEELFEAFVTSKSGSMGMGLAVSKSIIRAHDGTIETRSAEGGGAVFEFRLGRMQGADR